MLQVSGTFLEYMAQITPLSNGVYKAMAEAEVIIKLYGFSASNLLAIQVTVEQGSILWD